MKPGKTARNPNDLMGAMGSSNGLYGPLPPDDWLYRMHHSSDPEEQAMGWIHAHTIDLDHFSAFAADKHGHPLYARHLAADKDWVLGYAEHVLLRLEKVGRIRRDTGWDGPSKGKNGRGRIWVCADIPAAHQPAEPKPKDVLGRKSSVQNPFLSKPYIQEQLKNLGPDKIAACEAWANRFHKFRQEREAATLTNTRAILDGLEYNGFDLFGVKLQRQNKENKAAAQASKLVRVELQDIPEFVQIPFAESCTESTNGSVHRNGRSAQKETPGSNSGVKYQSSEEVEGGRQNGAARASSDSYSDIKDSSSSSATTLTTTTSPAKNNGTKKPSAREVDWILEALQQYQDTVDRSTARQLLEACRAKLPEITAGEVCDLLIHRVGKIAKNKQNPVGYIFRCVEGKVTAEELEKLRNKKAVESERGCPNCGRMSTIDGRCAGCGKTREEAQAWVNGAAAGGAS